MQNGECRFTAAIRDNTAWLNASASPAPEAALRGEATLSRALWHRRLCHIGADRLEQAIKGKVATVSVGACGSMDSAWTGAPVARMCVLSNFVARDSSPSI
jgi:hypothetical protein